MMLLLDLGNSRLKWALWAAGEAEWVVSGSLPWGVHLHPDLLAAWARVPGVDLVLAASVVDEVREQQVAAAVHDGFHTVVQWVHTPAVGCGIHNAYAEPGRLGVDRFLAMVAARAAGYAPCVLVSAGTALTLDALDVNGRHLGGLIAPGAQLMRESLIAAAARIPSEAPGAIVDVATNTADAVASGCWHALAALVERFVARVRAPLGGAPSLLVTGGDARQLLPLLDVPAQLVCDGVLRGLAHWAASEPERFLPSALVEIERRGA